MMDGFLTGARALNDSYRVGGKAMNVSSIGSAQRFEDLKKGDAFFWLLHGEKHYGIKAQADGEVGAVLIAPDRHDAVGISNQIATFSHARVFGGNFVLSMPDLKFVIFPSNDHILMGERTSLQTGKIYLFDSARTFLAFRINATTALLDIRSGDVADPRDFQTTFPVVISEWELVLEMGGKVKPLFTYPPVASSP
jgi:hypothetical protein